MTDLDGRFIGREQGKCKTRPHYRDPLPVSAASDANCVLALGFASPMPHRIDRPVRMLAQVTSAILAMLDQRPQLAVA